MAALPLAGRNALVLGVERTLGRAAAVALAEAGADVAAVTLTEAEAAEFAANSVANEFWALGRKGIALTTDGNATAVLEAIADATAELGPISILVWHAPAPLPAATLGGLRSDPAVVVLTPADGSAEETRALLAWTRDLAAAGLRANAILPSRAAAEAAAPALKQHHPPQPMTAAAATVYLTSDATAAVEGAVIIASD